ncbi:MAG TPA: GTPase domain-containing protein [Terracidiphilus sp.]|nr:GTPase domain-containing protein [Terracidiphilus sp.]
MSQAFPKFVPAGSPRLPADVSSVFAPFPAFDQARPVALPILRLEIRRSLQLHRRLASGLIIMGLALALLYVLNSWSIRTVRSHTNLEPSRLTTFEEPSLLRANAVNTTPALQRVEGIARLEPLARQLKQHSFHLGSGSGLLSLAAVAVSPWDWADSGVIRNALILVLSFILLGGAIAVVAHRADPQIYIASDVEQVLGFLPIAQLPDFSEVSHEVAEEHLLQLAAGIGAGSKDRDFKECVFTGTGPEVGVTTIAERLRKLFETTGSALTIADSPALIGSEETERLLRSAHCVVVVIQSGVTTRAELRAAANILQRMRAPAVAFVLNRVRLATADPVFRRSIKEMEKQLRKRGQPTNWKMLQTLEQAIEKGSASLDVDNRTATKLQDTGTFGKTTPNSQSLDHPVQTLRPAAAAHISPAAPAAIHRLQIVPRPQPEPAPPAREDIPSPQPDAAAELHQTALEPKVDETQLPVAASSEVNGDLSHVEPPSSTPEKTTRISLPRLSELRGMRFSQAIRDLDQAKRPVHPDAGLETLLSAIAPFEKMFAGEAPVSAINDGSPEAASTELDRPAPMPTLIPVDDARSPEQTSVDLSSTKENRNAETEQSPAEQNGSKTHLGGLLEQLHILPSRRGQYRKKG